MTAEEFKLRFPEFAAVPDGRVDLFIADATIELCPTRWGARYEKGLAYLAAHYLAIALKNEAAGGAGSTVSPLASRSVGDVSVSFATGSSGSAGKGEEFYNSTAYGQEYWALMQLVGIGVVVVN